MTKREQKTFLYHMFGGRCAYCGNHIPTIKEMQVDHIIPRSRFNARQHTVSYSVDDIQNKYPSCRRCNHYKRAHSLEKFRKLLKTLQVRLDKIYIYKIAKEYNVVKETPFDGVFFFEKQNQVVKKPIHAKPSLYAHYYESLKIIAKEYGFALLLHGSMNRDLDLVAVPWSESVKDDFEMIKEFDRKMQGIHSDDKAHYMFKETHHGRKQYVINLNRGGAWNSYIDEQYYIDISIMPTTHKLI